MSNEMYGWFKWAEKVFGFKASVVMVMICKHAVRKGQFLSQFLFSLFCLNSLNSWLWFILLSIPTISGVQLEQKLEPSKNNSRIPLHYLDCSPNQQKHHHR